MATTTRHQLVSSDLPVCPEYRNVSAVRARDDIHQLHIVAAIQVHRGDLEFGYSQISDRNVGTARASGGVGPPVDAMVGRQAKLSVFYDHVAWCGVRVSEICWPVAGSEGCRANLDQSEGGTAVTNDGWPGEKDETTATQK